MLTQEGAGRLGIGQHILEEGVMNIGGSVCHARPLSRRGFSRYGCFVPMMVGNVPQGYSESQDDIDNLKAPFQYVDYRTTFIRKVS